MVATCGLFVSAGAALGWLQREVLWKKPQTKRPSCSIFRFSVLSPEKWSKLCASTQEQERVETGSSSGLRLEDQLQLQQREEEHLVGEAVTSATVEFLSKSSNNVNLKVKAQNGKSFGILVRHQLLEEAYALVSSADDDPQSPWRPGTEHFRAVMNLAASKERPDLLVDVFRRMMNRGTKPDEGTFLALIRTYAQEGMLEEAYAVISHMLAADIFPKIRTYRPVLEQLCLHRRVDEIFALLDHMETHCVFPDPQDLRLILRALRDGGVIGSDDPKRQAQMDRFLKTVCAEMKSVTPEDVPLWLTAFEQSRGGEGRMCEEVFPSPKGVCPRCGQRLKKLRSGESERRRMRLAVLKLSATSGSKDLAGINFLRLFLNRNGPYTVLIDAPNVAYEKQNTWGGRFNYVQIELVRRALKARGERPLIILPRCYSGIDRSLIPNSANAEPPPLRKGKAHSLRGGGGRGEGATNRRRPQTQMTKGDFDLLDLWVRDRELFVCDYKSMDDLYSIIATVAPSDGLGCQSAGQLQILEGPQVSLEDPLSLSMTMPELHGQSSSSASLGEESQGGVEEEGGEGEGDNLGGRPSRGDDVLIVTNDLYRDHGLRLIEPRIFPRWRREMVIGFELSEPVKASADISWLLKKDRNPHTEGGGRGGGRRLLPEVRLDYPPPITEEMQMGDAEGVWHVPIIDETETAEEYEEEKDRERFEEEDSPLFPSSPPSRFKRYPLRKPIAERSWMCLHARGYAPLARTQQQQEEEAERSGKRENESGSGKLAAPSEIPSDPVAAGKGRLPAEEGAVGVGVGEKGGEGEERERHPLVNGHSRRRERRQEGETHKEGGWQEHPPKPPESSASSSSSSSPSPISLKLTGQYSGETALWASLERLEAIARGGGGGGRGGKGEKAAPPCFATLPSIEEVEKVPSLPHVSFPSGVKSVPAAINGRLVSSSPLVAADVLEPAAVRGGRGKGKGSPPTFNSEGVRKKRRKWVLEAGGGGQPLVSPK
uniref:PROP1-like PPR domain-containing protein n=1 Tax=Chromera velia CCMP2878 TaxID=1169474 RepID=A0A0G4IFM6_9ALVE|eukprot:Cvel_13939.t1-p1 / transcript=Cvel_13939.t1 / gene=Cvel_13939 / organism=Chromera_velia_CCMP2878 / gene_product=Pentatricopeptide repeat-containing protein, putative / transcript_product=Pentatricopeptide repeat-containing protein, putative / location=Cvel_scaffold973:27590-31391(+) / protein_length=995 / sequence_SO=supercontig / SO=protein_coding / is_pseudo=false